MTSTVDVRKLGKKFQDGITERWIFRNVDFAVTKGRCLTVIGPSGSGKSVLLKTIAGLYDPDEGTVHLSSKNIGMLFQKNALFDSMTVEQNLLFPLKEKKGVTGPVAQKRVEEYLDAVGLSGTGKLRPEELSGGMQKRLGIARALMIEPEIILYDEPTAGLDPITSKKIATLMDRLREENGTTVIQVTNDIQRAYQISDQIGFLNKGGFLLGGTPKEVQKTHHADLRNFIYGVLS